MFSEQCAAAVSSLLIGVLIARHLGPEHYGIYAFAIALVMLMSPIAKLGLDIVLVQRLISVSVEVQACLLSTAFWMKTAAGLLLFAITVAIAVLAPESHSTTAIEIAAVLLLWQGFEVISLYYQARVEAHVMAPRVIFQLLLSAGLKLWLIQVDAGVSTFLWALIADRAILAGLLYQNLRPSSVRFLCVMPNFENARELWAASWPLIFSGLAVVGYARIDQVMIGSLLNASEVGVYSVGIRITEVWLILPSVCAASFFPALVNAKADNEDRFRFRMALLYSSFMGIGGLVALCTLLFAEPLVIYIFGEPFRAAAGIAQIRIFETLFAALGILSSRWLHVHHQQRWAVVFTSSGLLCNVILNAFFIRIYGIPGAAVASVLSIIMTVLLVPSLLPATRPNVRLMLGAPWVVGRHLYTRIVNGTL